VPFRSKLIANFTASAKLGSLAPGIYNFVMQNKMLGGIIKRAVGFAVERSMPAISKQTLMAWYRKNYVAPQHPVKRVYLFCDEFTNYNDAHIGIKAVQLLLALGYDVVIPVHEESGRTWLSKGLVRKAKIIANKNIELLSAVVSDKSPLIGIEPSAILTFRDEYPDLARDENVVAAENLSRNSFYIDEFIANEITAGNITKEVFTTNAKTIVLHGHCQQKAVGSLADSVTALSLPANYTVQTIPSGCCGMAGSFGYEKEHYEVSMKIGELVLFPSVRKNASTCTVAAPGTSCRHQIKDGTGEKALHPVEILLEALL
jgi:Fe-S oxidoreductase